MVKPIYLYGNPVLREKARIIPQDYPQLRDLINDMYDTMYFAKGVGLAAPQIGLSIRLFVIDTKPFYEDNEKKSNKSLKKVFINPEIIEESGPEWSFDEGCLSIPGLNAEVERTTHIKLKYQDENFIWQEETFDEINARVIQHEFDHIEGILFIQKISPFKRQLINGKLNKIQKGQCEAKYPVFVNPGKIR
ncbi:MAG: peptide deformylase [Saprospiraceae bacterium]|nr:peptide deformylase [Saprospiraceae bacterium]